MSTNRDVRRMFEDVAKSQHELRRRIDKVENAPADLRHAAIDGGPGMKRKDADGNVLWEMGDTGVEHRQGPVPNQPSEPFVDVGGEVVKIQHSGLDVHEAPAPADFRRAHVHVSQTEAFEPGLSTLAGYMDAPDGSFTHRLPGGEWYVGIVWETLSGKHSPMSETVLADVAPLVDADEIDQAIEEAKTELEQAIDERGNRYGTEPPTEAAHDGVIYYQRDTEEGPVVAVWQYRDNQWHGLPLTDAVLTSVTTDKLVAGESLIDGVLIKDGAVTLEKMTVTEEMTAAIAQFLTVRTDMLEANAVTADKIGTDAIQARHIAAKAIESDMIEAGAIRTEHVDAKSFVLSDSDSYTRTSISAEGLEVIESWQGYPDPTLQDPDLLAARYTIVDDWHNYELTDAKGTTLFPDTRRFSIRFRITVHSMDGLEVRSLTREIPEAGIAYWTGSWDDIIDSPGDYFLGVGASDVYPYFGWVALKGDVTLHEMWFEPRENITELTLFSVTKDGLKAWDSSGSETASIGSGGRNFLAGRLSTNAPGQPGVVLSEDRGPVHTQGAGVWFTDDGTTGPEHAAIWAQSTIGTYPYTEYDILNIRAPEGGNVRHRSRSYFNELVDFDGHVNVWGTLYARSGMSLSTSRTTSYNANVHLDQYGLFARSTSASRYKISQRVMNVSDDLLDLDLKDWIDKAEVDRRDEAQAKLDAGENLEEHEWADLSVEPKRIPGVIAEDVEAIDDRFVLYNDDGQVENVMYDRLALTWIPIVRRQRDRITALETKTAELEARLARLEANMP